MADPFLDERDLWWAAMPSQDLDALTRSARAIPVRNDWWARMRGNVNAGQEWLTTNIMAPAQYALLYPMRVLPRYMDPEGKDSFWRGGIGKPGMPGPATPTLPQWQEMHSNVLKPINSMGTYTPGTRESDQIEDRRWFPGQSIWRY